MKFKLDENLGDRTQQLFCNAGHDVQTVRSQEIQGCSDNFLYNVCCNEQRCLVTLDLDFADVTRFPPAQSNGIVVLRIPGNPSLAILEKLIKQLIQVLISMPVAQNLWIIEIGRVRIHQPEPE